MSSMMFIVWTTSCGYWAWIWSSAAETASKKRPGLQLVVRLDNGEEVGVQVPVAKKKKDRQTFEPGDRVRLMTGADGSTQVTLASE